jgi:hypothetical protein
MGGECNLLVTVFSTAVAFNSCQQGLEGLEQEKAV